MSKEFSFPNKGTCSKETHKVMNEDKKKEYNAVLGGSS